MMRAMVGRGGGNSGRLSLHLSDGGDVVSSVQLQSGSSGLVADGHEKAKDLLLDTPIEERLHGTNEIFSSKVSSL